MLDNLERAINLAKKTGDRLIVFDSMKPANAYVVMSLLDYENLVLSKNPVRDLTEDELLDKINRDIAIWKNEQEYKESLVKQSTILDELANKDQADILDKTSSSFGHITKEDDKPKKIGGAWSIPEQRKQYAEEVIEEDRQYLEEVLY